MRKASCKWNWIDETIIIIFTRSQGLTYFAYLLYPHRIMGNVWKMGESR